MLETVTVICVAMQLITFYLENYAAHREPNNNSNNKLKECLHEQTYRSSPTALGWIIITFVTIKIWALDIAVIS